MFLVSDHGFSPLYCTFDVTGWLIENGYTAQREAKAGIKKALASVGILDEAVAVYRRLRSAVEPEARHGVDRMRDVEDEAATGKTYIDVDWSQTTAYATLDGGIRVNVRGREPHGVVDASDAERIATEIRDRLAGERFPNGEPIFEHVLLAGECFSGPVADRGPDVVIPPRTDAFSGPVTGHRFLVDRHRNSGEHGRYGVFVAWGPGVVPGATVEAARLIDVAALHRQPTRHVRVRIPVVVVDLHKSHTPLDHASREQGRVRECAGLLGGSAVELVHRFWFAREVGKFGHTRLHAVGKLVLLDARRSLRVV